MASETSSSLLDSAYLLEVARTAEHAGDLDRALGFYRGLGQVEPDNPRWAFEAVRLLIKSDRHGEANEALVKALKQWPKARNRKDIVGLVPQLQPSTNEFRDSLGKDCPPDEALKRAPVEDDGSDCIVARGGRRTGVIVFTGLADRMVLPLQLFDRYLAELDLSAVYLRDTKRIGYFHGISSLASDYEGTIERLKEMLVDLDAMTVHAIGNSAGGMAAVSYGLDLAARQILTFSAPLALTTQTGDHDQRANVFLTRLLTQVPDERRHLRERLEASRGRTRVHLYYGEDMREDRWHAEAVANAENVVLHPISGLAGHGALFRLAERPGLRSLFREMFSEND
jgi:hypothetical protein